MKLTEEHSDFRDHWMAFCDADPFVGSDTFPERMESAGLIEFVSVTNEALDEAFASERGIEAGGMMWQLTEAGRAALGWRMIGQTKGGSWSRTDRPRDDKHPTEPKTLFEARP